MDRLEAAIGDVARSQASVAVITGAGDRAFVSGGDLKELEALRTVEDAERMARRMRAILDRVVELPMPVIAALNGHALGGGAEIAVAADIRIAADDVRIGFTQSSLGIMPAWGGAERLTDLVGRSDALLLLCGGETLGAEEARAIGLVDRVVPRSGFEHAWRGLAAAFAARPSPLTRSVKQVVASVSPSTHPTTQTASIRAFAELWAAPEHWEMAAAADLKRKLTRASGQPGQADG
jgi:enoyl-CoA hydratase/carnithine racemase